VLLNRVVGEVSSVVSDNVDGINRATQHLHELGHKHICYVAGPEASWADGVRWRGLKEAGVELDLRVPLNDQRFKQIRDESEARKLAAIEAHDGDPKTLLTPSHAV
jgi:LacI family transcriptional regulator